MHKSEYTRRIVTSSRPAIQILEHQNDLISMKTLRNIDDAMMSLLLTLNRFHTFS